MNSFSNCSSPKLWSRTMPVFKNLHPEYGQIFLSVDGLCDGILKTNTAVRVEQVSYNCQLILTLLNV